MARIIAIDCGQKRTGLAVTDPMQMIATGLTTVASATVYDFLKDYMQKETVECMVMGLPKQLDNSPSESMRFVKPMADKLKKTFPTIPLVFYDERFTSALAHRAMIDGGLKKKDRQNKALVDEISAVILLQSYLESKK